MLLPLVLPHFFLIACHYAGGAAMAADAAMNCTIPCGDSTVEAVSKRMVEEGLIDAKTEQFCPPFVDANPARDLTIYALDADREMALQWTHKLKSLKHKLDHLLLGMRYRIRISTDRYFEKNVTFEMTSRFRKNQTSGNMITVPEIVMTLPKGSQALWHQHLFAQVQLYSDVLKVGGKWSETSPDWLLTSDCDREGQTTPMLHNGVLIIIYTRHLFIPITLAQAFHERDEGHCICGRTATCLFEGLLQRNHLALHNT